jgi:hypothetical protein
MCRTQGLRLLTMWHGKCRDGWTFHIVRRFGSQKLKDRMNTSNWFQNAPVLPQRLSPQKVVRAWLVAVLATAITGCGGSTANPSPPSDGGGLRSSSNGAACVTNAIPDGTVLKCKEYLSPADYPRGQEDCRQSRRVDDAGTQLPSTETSTWVTACPQGKLWGCKGSLPLGDREVAVIYWFYRGSMTCFDGFSAVSP